MDRLIRYKPYLNNIIRNWNFQESINPWTIIWPNCGIEDGRLVLRNFNGAIGCIYYIPDTYDRSHTYYWRIKLSSSVWNNYITVWSNNGHRISPTVNVNPQGMILDGFIDEQAYFIGLSFYPLVANSEVYIHSVQLYDLTAAYGAGNEPTVEKFLEDFPFVLNPEQPIQQTEYTVLETCGQVDLGSLTWQRSQRPSGNYYFWAVLPKQKYDYRGTSGCLTIYDCIFPRSTAIYDFTADKTINWVDYNNVNQVGIRYDEYTTSASFKQAMQGVILTYELANPKPNAIKNVITI